MNSFFKSYSFKVIVITLGIVIVLLTVFRAGMGFGFRRAVFAIKGAEHYQRNFIGIRDEKKMMVGFDDRVMPMPHGTTGKIIKIDLPSSTVILQGNDGFEKSIFVATSTLIRRMMDTIFFPDLMLNEEVTIIGAPNESGQIEAKFIRVFPGQ